MFEDNIEGENLEDSIIKLFATQIAKDDSGFFFWIGKKEGRAKDAGQGS
ncbi:MAG: hypothetical protein QME81_19650 [bacterium]|nr:hypothetical protein [bacterium]